MSTANLGTLVVRMALEIKRYKAELSEAVRDTRTAMDQAGRATDGLTQKSKGLEQQATNTARQVRELGGALKNGDYARAGQEAAGLASNVGRAGSAMGLLTAGVSIAATALVAYAAISYKASQEAERQANILLLTGNAAGLLAGDINAMARSVADSANTTVSKAREITEALVSTGKIGREATESMATAVELYAQASGETREKVAGDFSKMADGVAKWAAKHNETHNFITAAQFNYIRGLEEQGRVQEAMIVVNQASIESLKDVGKNLGTLQWAWKELGEFASRAWEAMLNIGRAETSQDQLAAATSRVNQLRDRIESRRDRGQLESTLGRDKALLEVAEKSLAQIQKTVQAERDSADARAANATKQKELIELSQKWGDISKKSLSDEAKLQERIQEIRAAGAAAGASQTEIEAAVAKAREDSTRSIGRQGAATAGLTEAKRALAEEYKREMAQFAVAEELVGAQIKLRREMTQEAERESAAIAANSAAYAAALDKQVLAAHADAAAAELQVAQYGLTKAQLAELTLAKLEDARAQALLSASTLDDVRALDAQVAAQKRVVQAAQSMEVKEAGTKAAKEAETAWKKTADSIESTLTESLREGFENGEGFAENLGDSVVNTFKTFVAKEIAKVITKAIMAALAQTQWGSALGSITGAFTGGGGGGTDWLSLAYKGYQYMSGGSTAATAAAYGTTVGSQQTTMLMAQEAGMGTAAGGGGASAAGIGAMGWAAIIAAAIYAGSELYDAGYDRTNLQGIGEDNRYSYGVENVLYKINEQTGLLNEKWANILSGTTRMAHMFGYKLHQTGIRGNFDGAGGIQTDQYESYKGGWLRGGDKVFSGPMEAGRAQSLTNSLRDVQDSTEVLVRSMGGNAEAVRDFAGGVTIDLRGLTQSEAAAKMAEEFQDLQYRMAEAAGISRDAFQGIIDSVNANMERAGISGQAIADIITAGATGRLDEVQVGAQLADVIIGGIYNAIAQGPADMVAQAFTSQIIQPLLTAAMMGAPLAGVVSQAAIQSVVATAQNAMAIINAVFSDPAFKQAINDVQSTISSVASISVRPARHVRAFGSAALAAGDAARRAAEEQKRAAEEIKRAWQGIADSITDEIRRLKGEILGTTASGQAAAQTQFVIATAQARAGDQEAAKMLPELSRAVVEIAEQTSTSLGDLRAVQGWTLASLQQTREVLASQHGITIPTFAAGGVHAGGLAKVGEQGPELVYMPPARVINAGDTRSMLGGNEELVREVRQLRKAVEAQDKHQDKMATQLKKLADMTESATHGGTYSDVRLLDLA